MHEALMPCPRCGGEPALDTHTAGRQSAHRVRCLRGCMQTAFHRTMDHEGFWQRARDAAVREWNHQLPNRDRSV